MYGRFLFFVFESTSSHTRCIHHWRRPSVINRASAIQEKKPFVLKALQSFSLCNLIAPTHIQDSFICWRILPRSRADLLPFEFKNLLCFKLGKACSHRPTPSDYTRQGYNPQIRGDPREQASYFTWERSARADLPQFWGHNLGLPRWGLQAFS